MSSTKNAATLKSSSSEYFIPAKTWQGVKAGYYFGTNQQGTGYYRDDRSSNGNNKEPPRKRAKVVFNEDKNETLTIPSNAEQKRELAYSKRKLKSPPASSINASQLLEAAEKEANQNKQCIIELTSKGIKTACIALRKAYEKNQLARAQSNDDDIATTSTPEVVDPSQYMESEITLFEHISSFKAIAANPNQLYPLLLQQKDDNDILSTILPQLLMHDNTDIVISVISLLLEWLDPNLLQLDDDDDEDAIQQQERNVQAIVLLAKSILQNCLELIVANLGRLDNEESQNNKKDDGDDTDDNDDEDDDVGKGQEDVLSLIENILEIEDYLMANSGDMSLVPTSNSSSSSRRRRNDTTADSSSVSVAAYMIRETPIVSWLFSKIETLAKQTTTTINKATSLSSRCFEILALLLKNEDVYRILPNWTRIPTYTSTFFDNNDNANTPKTSNSNVNVIEDDDDDNGKKKKNDKKKDNKPQHIDGLEILLLHGIAPYRKKQPTNEQQLEILENASTIIELGLTYSPQENMKAFMKAQGIELAIRCMKERVHAGKLCLSWLDFSTTNNIASDDNNIYKEVCEYMITNAGILKHIFPLYMGRQIPKPATLENSSFNKKQKREWYKHIEQQSIRIIYTLIKYIDEHSPQDCQQRLIGKFLETKEEKMDRFIELLLSYDKKARVAEYKFYRSDLEENILASQQRQTGENEEEIVNYAALEAKLRGGGDIFHRLGVIGAFCCIHSKRLHERIIQQLHLQQSGISIFKVALKEFISILNDDDDDDETENDTKKQSSSNGNKHKKSTTMTHRQQLQYYYDQI